MRNLQTVQPLVVIRYGCVTHWWLTSQEWQPLPFQGLSRAERWYCSLISAEGQTVYKQELTPLYQYILLGEDPKLLSEILYNIKQTMCPRVKNHPDVLLINT